MSTFAFDSQKNIQCITSRKSTNERPLWLSHWFRLRNYARPRTMASKAIRTYKPFCYTQKTTPQNHFTRFRELTSTRAYTAGGTWSVYTSSLSLGRTWQRMFDILYSIAMSAEVRTKVPSPTHISANILDQNVTQYRWRCFWKFGHRKKLYLCTFPFCKFWPHHTPLHLHATLHSREFAHTRVGGH